MVRIAAYSHDGVYEYLRANIDITEVVDGAEVGEKVYCVAHEDTDPPDMHVYEDHVHCYVCEFHADVTGVWKAMHGFPSMWEAAQDLAAKFKLELPEVSPEARARYEERRRKEDEHARVTLERHTALQDPENPKARMVREYLHGRGITDDIRDRYMLGMTAIGDLNIPFWVGSQVHGQVIRRLEGRQPKYMAPTAEEFPLGRRPILIVGNPKPQPYLLVEGYLDQPAAEVLGIPAIGTGAALLSKEQVADLRALGEQGATFYVLPDKDESGQSAAVTNTHRLYPYGFLTPPIPIEGVKDVADLHERDPENAAAILRDIMDRGKDALELAVEEVAAESLPRRAVLTRTKERVLPLLLKLEGESERLAAIEDIHKPLKLNKNVLKKALAEVQEKADAEALKAQLAGVEEDEPIRPPEEGSERHERAMKLLRSKDILAHVVKSMKALGHVGETATKQLAFICAISARMGKPIQPSTHAQSAAGKNFLWDTTLSLLPPEKVVKRSGLSAKALFRTDVDLQGAVLYIQEVAGSEDADFTIRVMQSDGRLEYEATEKHSDGSLRNVVYTTEGPTVVVQTTTKNHLHPENETRVFPIYIDETEAQTAKINEALKAKAAGRGISRERRESVVRLWHDAIRMLEPGEVVIPFAERIEIPTAPLRIRRDAPRLFDVIRVITWLHQYERERDEQGRIVATERDFHEALALALNPSGAHGLP